MTRIGQEMEKVKSQVGYEGDLKSFFDHVRNKKELMPFSDPQEVINNFYAIQEKMLPQVNKLFDLQHLEKLQQVLNTIRVLWTVLVQGFFMFPFRM